MEDITIILDGQRYELDMEGTAKPVSGENQLIYTTGEYAYLITLPTDSLLLQQ